MSDAGKGKNERDDEDSPFPFLSGLGGGGKNPKIPDPRKWGGWKFSLIYVGVLLIGMTLFNTVFMSRMTPTIDFSEFKAKIVSGEIKRVELSDSYFIGYTNNRNAPRSVNSLTQRYLPQSEHVYRTVPLNDTTFIKLLDDHGVAYNAISREGNWLTNLLFQWIIPFLVFFFLWRFLMRRVGGGLSGSVLSVGQSKAVIVAEGDVKTRFADVAGVDEAKEELVEVVDFLKSPKKYTDIGGRIPKGVLLVGPPGTGKTLLARAVAGEARVVFFRMSGADFVEMFVGVGAARVRDLFKQARSRAAGKGCIIFIDELDAIGKTRGSGNLGSNEERDQTLNALLVEMDGFNADTGTIVMASTNRPETLDSALLRPGRFDRHVLVDRPDIRGREEILKVHTRKVKLDGTIDLHAIASITSGFAGADLAALVNEAALLAARVNKNAVTMEEFNEAAERVTAGLKKKRHAIRPDEKLHVAYHESGHAMVAYLLPAADTVHKISIIPRGAAALGYTLQRPDDDRYLMTREELECRIQVFLAGTLAEEMIFGTDKVTSGAQNDLERATELARSMVMDFGMSRLGRINYRENPRSYIAEQRMLQSRLHSEQTAWEIDQEIKTIMEEMLQKTREILETRRETLQKIADYLLEKEVMDTDELTAIIEGKPIPVKEEELELIDDEKEEETKE